MEKDYIEEEIPDYEYKALIYDTLTDALAGKHDEYRYEPERFRDYIYRWMTDDPDYFRKFVEYELNRKHGNWQFSEYIALDDLPIHLQKFKACANCGRIFYDISRNGRTKTCRYREYYGRGDDKHKNGRTKYQCEMEWEARKEVRRFNRKKYGIDTDEKQGIPSIGRYSVPRRLKKGTIGGPITIYYIKKP